MSFVLLAFLGCTVTGWTQSVTAAEQKSSLVQVLEAFKLPTNPDFKIVAKFFEGAGEVRFTLSTESKELTVSEKHALAWLIQTLHSPPTAKQKVYNFRLSRTKLGTTHAYELRHVAAVNPTAIQQNKFYLQVQYFPVEGLACPEFHAVIEIETLKVVSKWSEGG